MRSIVHDNPESVKPSYNTAPPRRPVALSTPHIIPVLGADARYILIPSGSKAPTYPAWQRGGHDATAALVHAARGGNLGLLCGAQSGWLIALDADAGAAELAQRWPILGHTIRIWRDNAPDRCKWIVRCHGATTCRDHTAGLEILAGSLEAGTNAVVWGVHPSGARLRVEGDAVITLSLDDLAAIWQWRTASTRPAGAPTRADIAVAVPTPRRSALDAARLAYNAQTPIDGLLRLAGCTQSARSPRRWIPRESRNGTDSLLINTDTNTVYAFSAVNPVGREGLIWPSDLAAALGVTIPTTAPIAQPVAQPVAQPEPLAALLDAWRDAAINEDLAPQWRDAQRRLAAEYRQRAAQATQAVGDALTDAAAVGPSRSADYWQRLATQAAQRADAPRWPEAGIRRIMLALLDLFAEAGSRRLWVSTLRVASAANMSDMTAGKHLEALQPWFVTVQRRGDKQAPILEIAANVVGFRHDPYVRSYLKPTTPTADAPLRTHYAHDAYAVGWTPLPDTPDTWAAVCETADRIRTGATQLPDDTELACYPPTSAPSPADDEAVRRLEAWRRRCAAGYVYVSRLRMGADLASLGGRGLLLVQRLWQAGGELSGPDAAAALDCNRATLSRLVARLVDAGVATQPAWGVIALAPDWAESLEAAVQIMPSYGMYAARRAAYLDTRIARLDDAMLRAVQAGDASPELAATAQVAVDRLQATLDDAEGERAALDVWAEGHLPDPQRRRVLTRHGTWDAQRAAVADAARRRRQAERDRVDAAAEAAWRAELDAAAGISVADRRRADDLLSAEIAQRAWAAAKERGATV